MSGDNSVRTSAASAASAPQDSGSATLRVEDVLARKAQLDTEAERLCGGRAVCALKVGRLVLASLRSQGAVPSPASVGAGIWGPDTLFGIAFYEVDIATYFEPIYVDEAPDLAALNARLMAYPPLRGGPLSAESGEDAIAGA